MWIYFQVSLNVHFLQRDNFIIYSEINLQSVKKLIFCRLFPPQQVQTVKNTNAEVIVAFIIMSLHGK